MNIKLAETKLLSFFLEPSDETENEITFDYSDGYSDDEERSFIVHFEGTIKSKQSINIKFSYIAKFETDELIDDAFRRGHFPLVNAPAIAYPFLRSLISTITVNAGYEPILMPTINFQKHQQRKQLNDPEITGSE